MSVVRIREDLLCEEDFRISDSMQAAGLTGIVIDIQLGPESCHKNPDTSEIIENSSEINCDYNMALSNELEYHNLNCNMNSLNPCSDSLVIKNDTPKRTIYTCAKCNFTCHKRRILTLHFNNYHSNSLSEQKQEAIVQETYDTKNEHVCVECNYKTRYRSSLTLHMKKHTRNRLMEATEKFRNKNGYKFIWTKKNKIFIKKDIDTNIIQVTDMNVLDSLK